jgi:hypothetical protein
MGFDPGFGVMKEVPRPVHHDLGNMGRGRGRRGPGNCDSSIQKVRGAEGKALYFSMELTSPGQKKSAVVVNMVKVTAMP